MSINIDQIKNKALRAVAIKVDNGNNQLEECEFIDFMKTAKQDENSMSDIMTVLHEERMDSTNQAMVDKLNELEKLERELESNTDDIESDKEKKDDLESFGIGNTVGNSFFGGLVGTLAGGLAGLGATKIFRKGKLAVVGMVLGAVAGAIKCCSDAKKEYHKDNAPEIRELNKDISDTEVLNEQLRNRIETLKSEIYGE